MYKLFSSILFLCFTSTLMFGQDVSITQRDALMSLGSRPAYMLKFDGISSGDVEDLWKDFSKDRFDAKAKYSRKTKEYTSKGASASSIHTADFDMYSMIDGSKEYATLTVWFDLGTNFLNPTDNEVGSQEAQGYLLAFNNEVEKKKGSYKVKDEKKALDDLEDDLKKLKKKNDDLHKDIDSYQEKIRKTEEEIKGNEADQEKKQKEIDDQEKNLNDAQKHLDGIGG